VFNTPLQERQLQLLNYEGVLIRTWLLDAAIRYVKAAGGPPGREGVLIGLKSGDVVKVFADNPFPVPLIKHGVGIRCATGAARAIESCNRG
jgi:intraflagellar transport protein 122